MPRAKRLTVRKTAVPADRNPSGDARPELICFSHLRWDWVFQRPQHLMTRFARSQPVYYVEEPVFDRRQEPLLKFRPVEEGISVVTPHLPMDVPEAARIGIMRDLLDSMMKERKIEDFIAWYYSPLFLPYSSHLRPRLVVYDCMDELSAFAGANPLLQSQEEELLARAGLVLTGGASLFEAKRNRHPNVHLFPSSIDKEHFWKARLPGPDPADQAAILRPRIGFHGVIDERIDFDLLARAADLKPDWQWIMVGPICKIDPAALPRRSNIHYLGKKEYADLPAYLAGWDACMMPFARNESTKYISPTKTPEYLSAGKAVVSTSIRDVVEPYGREGLVLIADTAEEFVAQCKSALRLSRNWKWHAKAGAHLAGMSWEKTWAEMNGLVMAAYQQA
jgi:glycosyltransferase involved in cell wall biosynthesis